ncbi:SPASM domain-containing protein [Thermodesulfobacteriota bacterium]
MAFNIVTLLTDANVGRAEEIYRFFRSRGFPFLQFINCLERVRETDRLEDFSVGTAEVGDFYRALFDLWIADGFPNVSVRLFEDILIYLIDGVHVSCCWMDACDSYLVVEHNGDCYPCDFFVDPNWKVGNLVGDDVVAIMENPLRRRFSAMKSNLPESCRGCELSGFCNGDCTKFRRGLSGGTPGPSEYCEAWRSLLQHMAPHIPRIREAVARIRSQ